MKDKYIIINIIIVILIIVIICLIIYEIYGIIIGGDTDIQDVNWPFINLLDENKDKVDAFCLRGPLVKEEDIKIFETMKEEGKTIIGCSSYLSFPLKCNNPSQSSEKGVCYERPNIKGLPIESLVDGWLHCFRDPSKIQNKNLLLLSESDFMDSISRLRQFNIQNKENIYDFLCYCPNDPNGCIGGWHFYNKNWPLAKKTIEVACNELSLKGILIGRDDCDININDNSYLERENWLQYHKFLKAISNSKFMIISSSEDASPRTIAESLLLNTPILVNEDILGGWKYVNHNTGLFYNQYNINEKIQEILENIKNNQY